MNHKPLIPLITLLKILDNRFEPEKQRRLEMEVQQDSVTFDRLKQLRDTASSTTLKLNETEFNSTDQEYELQQIAAFLDGTLSDKESLAFENKCWASERLLHDLVVLFRSGLESHANKADSSTSASPAQQQLRERLVGLFPVESPVGVSFSDVETGAETEATGSNESSAADDEPNLDLPPVIVPEHLSKKKKTKPARSKSTKVAVVIAAAVAMVAFSVVVANWDALTTQPTNDSPTVVIDPLKGPENTDQLISPPKVVESKNRDKVEHEPDSLIPEQIVDLPNTDNQPQDIDKTLPDSVDPKTQVVQSPKASTSNDKPNDAPMPRSPKLVDDVVVEPATRQAKLQWNWSRIEGLIATRTGQPRRWSGASAKDASSRQSSDDPDTNRINADEFLAMDCKVLPLSWGQATVKGMGSWTVTENTDFSIQPVPARRMQNEFEPGAQAGYRPESVTGAKIKLRCGGLAISDANVDSVFLIETPTGNWRIKITDPATVVIVEQFSASRLVVQHGSISVGGKELNARQQLVRSAVGQLEQLASREAFKWLKRPVNKFPSKRLSAQWQASRDLFTDLGQPNVVSPEDQPLVRFAFATIDPPGQAKLYLANVSPEVRAEGIQWLLVYGSDPRRLRKLASELATEMNSPGIGRALPRLVLAIQTKRWPAKADAELLIKGLPNRNVSVRRLSHSLLVHMFGPLADYDPDSKPPALNAQAHQWDSATKRLYQRVKNAQQ